MGNNKVLAGSLRRGGCGRIGALLAFILLLAFALSFSSRGQSPAQSTSTNSSELLQFLDGTTLHGALVSVDSGHGLRWRHPSAKSDFDLSPTHLDRIRFPQANSVALTPNCHLCFAGGDDLYGTLLSLDAETLQFSTWFGGTVRIPRSAVQSIAFLPKGYAIVYEGPSEASDWKITSGQQYVNAGGVRIQLNGANFQGNNMVVLGNGQVIFGGGGNLAVLAGPTNWTYRDGSFVSAGSGTLGRNFGLKGSCTIEFDLTCNGSFSLLINLYSVAVDRVGSYGSARPGVFIFNGQRVITGEDSSDAANRGSLLVQLSDTQAVLLRNAKNWLSPDNHGETMTNIDTHGRPCHVTFSCNKEEGSLTLMVDGVTVKKWGDITGFDEMGENLVFQNQTFGSTIGLSHFKVSKWEGKYEPGVATGGAVGDDTVSFINHDRAGGKVEGITDGKLVLVLGGNTLHIPAERVRQIDFAESSAVREPRGPWEVRAVFPGGGSVSFQLAKWDEQAVSGRSALFGPLAFLPAGIREIQFNLDQPRTEPVVPVEDEYDALDQ